MFSGGNLQLKGSWRTYFGTATHIWDLTANCNDKKWKSKYTVQGKDIWLQYAVHNTVDSTNSGRNHRQREVYDMKQAKPARMELQGSQRNSKCFRLIVFRDYCWLPTVGWYNLLGDVFLVPGSLCVFMNTRLGNNWKWKNCGCWSSFHIFCATYVSLYFQFCYTYPVLNIA